MARTPLLHGGIQMIVRYRVPSEHLTETVRGEETLHGSIHHQSEVEFTGLITRLHPGEGRTSATADLVIFPPGKAPVHLEGVSEGDGPGSFTAILSAAGPPARSGRGG